MGNGSRGVNYSEGLRPSDSPTRSLACRFAGSLRSRGLTRTLVRQAIPLVAMFLFVMVAPHLGARSQQAPATGSELLRFCPGLGIPCVEITRQAYDRGYEQFRQSCGFCHGPTAAGGNGGPNLIYSAVIRRDNQGADITKVIQEGRPEKGMPVIPLTATQIADIVGYLKARVAEVDKTSGLRPSRDYDLKKLLTGNAELGKAYFNGPGQCATCHSPTGDLKGIGTKYPPIELQARFLYPTGVRQEATVTVVATVPSKLGNEPVARFQLTLSLKKR